MPDAPDPVRLVADTIAAHRDTTERAGQHTVFGCTCGTQFAAKMTPGPKVLADMADRHRRHRAEAVLAAVRILLAGEIRAEAERLRTHPSPVLSDAAMHLWTSALDRAARIAEGNPDA